MKEGRIDFSMVNPEYDYMIVYSNPDAPDVINTWVLPNISFQSNFKSMVKRGCVIHNVFKKMTEKDLLESMLK